MSGSLPLGVRWRMMPRWRQSVFDRMYPAHTTNADINQTPGCCFLCVRNMEQFLRQHSATKACHGTVNTLKTPFFKQRRTPSDIAVTFRLFCRHDISVKILTYSIHAFNNKMQSVKDGRLCPRCRSCCLTNWTKHTCRLWFVYSLHYLYA